MKKYIEEGNEKLARLNVDRISKDWNNNFAIICNCGEYFFTHNRHEYNKKNIRITTTNAEEIISKILLYPVKNPIITNSKNYITLKAIENDLGYYNGQLKQLNNTIACYEATLKEVNEKQKK
jgi:hypothetical protein